MWYGIKSCTYQMHKLYKSQTENEAGEAKGKGATAQKII